MIVHYLLQIPLIFAMAHSKSPSALSICIGNYDPNGFPWILILSVTFSCLIVLLGMAADLALIRLIKLQNQIKPQRIGAQLVPWRSENVPKYTQEIPINATLVSTLLIGIMVAVLGFSIKSNDIEGKNLIDVQSTFRLWRMERSSKFAFL